MRSHLRSPRGNELVEHDLRAVGEIAELRLPHGERIGLGQRIAVLEAEHRLLRQHRVDDLEARLPLGEMIERRIPLLGLLIEQHGVALREGAALAVLAGKPHPMPVEQQGAEGQRLRCGPVDVFPDSIASAPVFQETIERAVQVEIRRQGRDLAADVLERGDLDARASAARIVAVGGALESRPAAVEPVGLVGAVVLRGFQVPHRGGPASRPSSSRLRAR